MRFFDRLTAECNEHYQDAGIVIIPRAKIKNRWIDADWNQNVTCLDSFQSFSDIQNDVKAFIIKPLACLFLFKNQLLNSLYEFALSAIHLITCSPILALEHLGESANSLAQTCAYFYLGVCELTLQTLSLVMRTLITVGFGLGQAGSVAGQEMKNIGSAVSGIFNCGLDEVAVSSTPEQIQQPM